MLCRRLSRLCGNLLSDSCLFGYMSYYLFEYIRLYYRFSDFVCVVFAVGGPGSGGGSLKDF